MAAHAAREYGVYRTARELRLNYNALQGRMQSVNASLCRKDPAPAAFVEFVHPGPASFSECTVEIEARNGIKMRVHLKSSQAPDLGAISSAFLSARA